MPKNAKSAKAVMANPFASVMKPKAVASKGSDIAMIDAPESIHADVTNFIKAKQDMENAEAALACAISAIQPVGDAEIVKASICDGKAVSSVRLKVDDDQILTYTLKDAYSAVRPEDVGVLKDTFKGKYDTFFSTNATIRIKKDADMQKLAEKIAHLGIDFINEFFEGTEEVKPTSAFHNARLSDANMAAKVAHLMGNAIRPYKPTISVYRS